MRKIRKSEKADLPEILEIYARARERMAEEGNAAQWITYPEREVITRDMELGQSYVITDDGKITGTFVFYSGEEPDYRLIEGRWLSDGPYGVIHRIAGDGEHRGILRSAADFAFSQVNSVRVDTHEKNRSMRAALGRLGFSECGTIYISDDSGPRSPRIAYQKTKEAN